MTVETGETIDNGRERRIAETRFIWIPGRRPVIVPIIIPSVKAIKSPIIILLFFNQLDKLLEV